jgi:hypothetical protein
VSVPFIAGTLYAQDDVWRQDQLNETYMRTLTKHVCMEKTIRTLKMVCKGQEQCVKTMAGVVGDCVTWAKGDSAIFCAQYDNRYIGRYCFSNYLDGVGCGFLHSAKDVLCKAP